MAELRAVMEFRPIDFINPTKSGGGQKLDPFSSKKSSYKISANLVKKLLSYEQ